MEFRRYDKIDCSFFDLIDGDLEPKQTMALGYLLAKSKEALKALLKLIGVKVRRYDSYIVDCEAQKKQLSNNDRIDILIRFYSNYQPTQAIIIEAKSVRANTSAQQAGQQVQKYTAGFGHLANFDTKNVTSVVLTRTSITSVDRSIISISWSRLISVLHDLVKPKTDDDQLIKYFVKFITNVKGSMKYYEEEILSIPAGKTINAIKASGIYECPINYNAHKKSLYVTFRESGMSKGKMDTLYKLIDIFEIDLNDTSAIDIIDKSINGFAGKITQYKTIANYNGNDHSKKQVYLLDVNNTITLPIPVRPVENNTAPVYYRISEFFGKNNSNLKDVIVVQKNITIDGNTLNIQTSGKKTYKLYENGSLVKTFINNGSHSLNTSNQYQLTVTGTNRNVQLQSILITNGTPWQLYYIF
jgi:hypothetical protein